MGERYKVGTPTPGGSRWWDVTDTEQDQIVAQFFDAMPNAEAEALALCDRLNGKVSS